VIQLEEFRAEYSAIFVFAKQANKNISMQSPFYYAPSIFAVFRNLVREIWFKKSGSANSDFFSGSRKVVDKKKRWVYTYIHLFSGWRKLVLQNQIFFWFEKSC
jgi:hypothetical protein